MGSIALLAAVSGVGQALGYLLYIRHALRHETRPNAAAACMFAYGTILLAIIEYDQGADWPVLVLPITCAMLGIVVAALCFRRGIAGPIDPLEITAFAADLILTVSYVGIWLLRGADAIPSAHHAPLTLAFLVAVNATSVTSFAPLVRSTWLEPSRERPLPWLVWTASYALLAGITLASDADQAPSLLIYPILNAGLHLLIVLITLGFRVRSASADAG